MPKVLKWTCRRLWCLSTSKKSNSSLSSFLRYCKDIANLLLWELWECLTIPIKNHSTNLQETFMPICMDVILLFLNSEIVKIKYLKWMVGNTGSAELNWQYKNQPYFSFPKNCSDNCQSMYFFLRLLSCYSFYVITPWFNVICNWL